MTTTKLIRKFNSKATSWLEELKNMDEISLTTTPSINSWSMAELYDHIMRVARTYQIPNLKKSTTEKATLLKRKNMLGFAIFNIGIRRQVTIKMEEFPPKLVKDFTPIKRNKKELIVDFKKFIKEVNQLESILLASNRNNKQYHPMFGNITAANWFSLIEIHMSHHELQKTKILSHINSQVKTT